MEQLTSPLALLALLAVTRAPGFTLDRAAWTAIEAQRWLGAVSWPQAAPLVVLFSVGVGIGLVSGLVNLGLGR